MQHLAQSDALGNCIITCEKPSYPGSSRGEAHELEPESKQGLRSKVSADGAVRDSWGREKTSDIEWHIGRVYCITGGEGKEEVEVAWPWDQLSRPAVSWSGQSQRGNQESTQSADESLGSSARCRRFLKTTWKRWAVWWERIGEWRDEN